MDRVHKEQQARKKKQIQDQMRQKNLDMQLLRGLQTSVKVGVNGEQQEDENGIFNQLS